MPAKHYLISGKVQEVFYRKTTKATADQLGLTGWVRNLPDGRVEVLACGDANLLAQFETYLHQGPSMARVDEVIIEILPDQDHQGFVIRDAS